MPTTLTRLQPGMRVLYDGRPHRVVRVSEGDAKIVPVEKRVVTITPLVGKPVTFRRTEPGHHISPNSEVPIL